jgi:protein pelota
MKILRKFFDKKMKGYYTLQPESDEDLWFLYNIVKSGDAIKLKIKRKIQETTMTGLTKTNKKNIWAKLEVLDVGFDYDNKGTSLYCKTKTLEGNDYLEVGQIQSIEIPLIYPITIYKTHWDAISRGFIEESLKQNEKSDIGVLLIEDGLANAYYMKSNYSLWQGKVEKTMPRKKSSLMEFYKKAFTGFQERCLDLIVNIFDLDTIKCFIIAGPGTSPKNFYNFLSQHKDKQEFTKLKKNFSKIMVIPASSAQKSALMEIIEDETVQKNINDTRAQKETQILQKFMDMIRTDPLKVRYSLTVGCIWRERSIPCSR